MTESPTRSRRASGVAKAVTVALAAALAAGASGCAPGPGQAPVTTTTSAPAPTSSAPATASAVASPPPAPQFPPRVKLTTVASTLSQPLDAVTANDGTDRIFVVEKTGAIRIIRDGRLLPQPFLDLSALVSGGAEQGLLGLAFSPGFASNGRFFVTYTDRNGDYVLAAYDAPRGSDVAGASEQRRILFIPKPFPNHNGGGVAFGPDGYLYVGTGDGGGAGDTANRAQNPTQLLGKMLRIDPEGSFDAGRSDPYLVPRDNPFAGRPLYRPEIWLMGMRNPWRFSFDRDTGELWIGDVGQGAWEEIDVLPKGKGGFNMGWHQWEGDHPYPPGSSPSRSGFTFPIAEYPHPFGESITGGYVYRGTAHPEWDGTYFYADYVKGQLMALRRQPAGGKPATAVLERTGLSISSFGQDDAGQLYLTDLAGGRLYRLDAR